MMAPKQTNSANPALEMRVVELRTALDTDLERVKQDIASIQARMSTLIESFSDALQSGGLATRDSHELASRVPLDQERDIRMAACAGSSETATKHDLTPMGRLTTQRLSHSSSSVLSDQALDAPPVEQQVANRTAAFGLGSQTSLISSHINFDQPLDLAHDHGLVTKIHDYFVSWKLYTVDEPHRVGHLAAFVDVTLPGLSAFVIIVNAIAMGAAINERMANPRGHSPVIYDTMEAAFVIFYILEQILKLAVHRMYHLIGPDYLWTWFDLLLIALALTAMAGDEISTNTSLRSLRILRATKVLRLVRVFSMFSELRNMLRALMASALPLTWSLVMLSFLLYIFALCFVQACGGRLSEDDVDPGDPVWNAVQAQFKSVQLGMLTLMASLLGGQDWLETLSTLELVSVWAYYGFIFYLAFFNIAVMNIVTGMFVQAAMKLGQPDTDEQALDTLRCHINGLNQLRAIACELDVDGDGVLSREELEAFILNPEARSRLEVLDVDARDAETFVNLLAASSGTSAIPVQDFVSSCFRLRGPASAIDLQCQSYRLGLIHQNQVTMLEQISALESEIKAVAQQALENHWKDSQVEIDEAQDVTPIADSKVLRVALSDTTPGL